MLDRVRCECGNEVRSLGIHPLSIRCAVCGRQPPLGVMLVNQQIGIFAIAMILIALLTAAPGVWVMIEMLTRPTDEVRAGVPAWALISIFAALAQIGYSVYLLQIPHWIGLQAVACVSLFWAAVAAIVFGGALVGGAGGWAGTILQLGDLLPATRGPKLSAAALWCFLLTVAWSSFSIVCGWRAQIARAQQRAWTDERSHQSV